MRARISLTVISNLDMTGVEALRGNEYQDTSDILRKSHGEVVVQM